ncbi:acyltransferase family domain-containing protein [Trichoderma ceciliae]
MLQESIPNPSRDWEEVKADYDPELVKESKGYMYTTIWKAPSCIPKHKRVLGRLISALYRISDAFFVPETLRPTAYLDGLRGFAAFVVYWHHHELWVHGWTNQNAIFENGFGYDGKYHMAAFPFVRNLFSGGHYAVSTFFVISGYVLSLKPLGLLQAGELAKLGDNLASAFFRRWPRLYVPSMVVVFVYAMSWHIFGMWINGTKTAENWRDEAWSFYTEFKNFSFVFKEGGVPWLSYNFHLWSIPVEFKGSMVVYASQLALSRCSREARLWCEASLVFYFMFITDGWYCAMFCTGMLLCDLDLLARKGELPRFLLLLEPFKDFIYHHLFVFSLFLGGVPSQNSDVQNLQKSRGWYYLAWFKPQAVFDYKWFYLWLAATFLVASIPRIPWLKRFFETRFCQSLGRISFALYMVHGPVLWTVGDRLYAAVGWKTDDHLKHIPHWVDKFPLPKAGPLGLEVSFLAPHLILLPLTLALAEAVTRWVDTPSVKFASWLYHKALGGGTESVLGKLAKA